MTGPAIDDVHSSLYRMRTLLRAALEVCDEASSEAGLYHRAPGWERARFDHLNALLNIVWEETERAERRADHAWNDLITFERVAA